MTTPRAPRPLEGAPDGDATGTKAGKDQGHRGQAESYSYRVTAVDGRGHMEARLARLVFGCVARRSCVVDGGWSRRLAARRGVRRVASASGQRGVAGAAIRPVRRPAHAGTPGDLSSHRVTAGTVSVVTRTVLVPLPVIRCAIRSCGFADWSGRRASVSGRVAARRVDAVGFFRLRLHINSIIHTLTVA